MIWGPVLSAVPYFQALIQFHPQSVEQIKKISKFWQRCSRGQVGSSVVFNVYFLMFVGSGDIKWK